MTEGVVYDLGYRPHEGERLGRAGAVRALYRDGLRRVLGLRRRARAKIWPVGPARPSPCSRRSPSSACR